METSRMHRKINRGRVVFLAAWYIYPDICISCDTNLWFHATANTLYVTDTYAVMHCKVKSRLKFKNL